MDYLFIVLWRSLLVFVFLLILARILGRKLLSQLTYFDFVIGITIGTVSGVYVVETLKGKWILLSPLVFILASFFVSWITSKNLPARKILKGEPIVVIENGKILENNLKKVRYNLDDLEMLLRDKGVFDLTEVEFAVLEPHGHLSVLRKSQYLPLTPRDMKIDTEYKGVATEIIKEGVLLEDNLKKNRLSFAWLYEELKKQEVDKVTDIFYASLNTDGSLFIDLKDDAVKEIKEVEN